jgi:GNAT superfamily N-acetyltransferase
MVLMRARPAKASDAAEVVRLATAMFESMGADLSDQGWVTAAVMAVDERLGRDLAVFVVDHPSEEHRLVASAAGTINRRLPTPMNPGGLAGYVQWVCTDTDYRGRGLARQVMASLMDWYSSQGVPAVELHATPMAEPLYRCSASTTRGHGHYDGDNTLRSSDESIWPSSTDWPSYARRLRPAPTRERGRALPNCDRQQADKNDTRRPEHHAAIDASKHASHAGMSHAGDRPPIETTHDQPSDQEGDGAQEGENKRE